LPRHGGARQISYGQIYPELKRLDVAGFIFGEAEPGSGRQKRVYSLAPAGEQALREWLTSPGDLHTELRHEGVLRLFFSDALSPSERRELVEQMRAKHERLREELRAIAPAAQAASEQDGDTASLLTLETGIAYQELFVELCDRLERRLAEIDATSEIGS
jgi:PadR family transcriptional regulator AphA